MYDSWYSRESVEHNDQFYEDFEVFGLRCQGAQTRLKKLESEDVEDWVKDQDTRGITKLLLTRHKRHQQHEIKPWYMAFDKKTFDWISDSMKLPLDYLSVRKSAAGCGVFNKHTKYSEEGTISLLSFSIRVPHSPRNNSKAIWSMSVSWNLNTRQTNAILESVSDADVKEESSRNSLYVIEDQLGVTRGKRQSHVWDWDYELHRESTKRCNDIYTGLVYLERRLQFAVGLSQFLLDCLASLKEEGLDTGPGFLEASKMMKETAQNNHNFAKSQHSQALCLQKRCQALITMMFTVIAQQDSKINVNIARAAKRDSSSMTAIAVLGFIFLPAMLVASMFSMSMFDFSSTSTSFITSDFWVYWAVTIPLTLLALTLYRVWMSFQNDISAKNNKILHTESTTIVQDAYEANLALETPFYPQKPGMILSSHVV